jgi:hypothetical protein
MSRRPRAWGSGLVLLATASVALAQVPAQRRGKAFWNEVAKDCAVPVGETAFGLVSEAVSLLGSPDPEWRDDVGYVVVATCVYGQKRLRPEERRQLVRRLSANLRRGIGEIGNDSVLLRSFSALDLSVFAALENADPALDEAGYRRLLDDALAYLRDERDLRGFEPRVGWVHATAHTADLLKFLARNPRFAPADRQRLLDAAWEKMTAPGTAVFTHAEDERMAAAVLSVVRRPGFDPAILDPWLARFPALEKQVWSQTPPDPARLDASQNARNLLRSLYVALSLPGPAPSGASPTPAAAEEAAREKVRATLAAIRR